MRRTGAGAGLLAALAVPILVIGAAGVATGAAPASGPQVVIRVMDGDQVVGERTVTAADLAGCPAAPCDVHGEYTLRTASGRERQTAGEDDWVSLASLVSGTPHGSQPTTDPASATYTEVVDPLGISHPLDAGRLTTDGADLPPAVRYDGTSITYVRALTGPDDYNLTEDPDHEGYFQTSPDQGQTITVLVHLSGRLLHPTVAATPVPGKPRTYRLSTTLADPPDGVGYAWDLGDGASAATPDVRHTWPTGQPSYTARLVVRAPDGSWGRASVPIVVDDQPDPTDPPDPGGSDPPLPGETGPGTTGPRHSAGSGTGRGQGRSGGAGDAAASPSTPVATPPAGGPRPPRSADSPRIVGRLLSAAIPGSAAPATGRVAITPTTASHRVPAWMLGVGGLLALYLGGLLLEVRRSRTAPARITAPRASAKETR